jgi:hypothetical protein
MNNFPVVRTEIDYYEWKTRVGSESNGLENIVFHTIKDKLESVRVLKDSEYLDMLKDCTYDLCSCAEYFTILPKKDDFSKFIVWYSTSNVIDSRVMQIEIESASETIQYEIDLNLLKIHYFEVDKQINPTNITLYENGKVYKSIDLSGQRLEEILAESGIFTRL